MAHLAVKVLGAFQVYGSCSLFAMATGGRPCVLAMS
jgi:hypothetical protein